IGGTYPAPGGSDRVLAAPCFPRLVERSMVRHREVGTLTDEQVVWRDGHSLAAKLCHFLEQSERVDHHAIADDAEFIGPDDAAGNKVQNVLLPVADDGMAR